MQQQTVMASPAGMGGRVHAQGQGLPSPSPSGSGSGGNGAAGGISANGGGPSPGSISSTNSNSSTISEGPIQISLVCQSRTLAVRLYKCLAQCASSMGNPSSVLAPDVATKGMTYPLVTPLTTLSSHLTHSLIHSLTHSLIYSFTHSLIYSPTHPLTRSITHPLSHSPTHPLTHSLTHSPTRSPANAAGPGLASGSMAPLRDPSNMYPPSDRDLALVTGAMAGPFLTPPPLISSLALAPCFNCGRLLVDCLYVCLMIFFLRPSPCLFCVNHRDRG